jgi:transcription elongation GreA/GreB family factor
MPLEALRGEAVRLGALVEALEDGAPVRFFLAPSGGGTRLPGDVQVVTPGSPLGRALVGKRVGDELEVQLAGKTRLLALTRVA